MSERLTKHPCVTGDCQHQTSHECYNAIYLLTQQLEAENAKMRTKNKGLVKFLKDDTFSLPDRISNAIKTLENDND